MAEITRELVREYHMSVHDIDETELDSLMEFMLLGIEQKAYIDEVGL